MTPQHAWLTWENWVTYFEHNAERLMPIDWGDGYRLSPQEAIRITNSVQQFQLGESSEGKHVQERARRFAATSGESAYLVALKLFIKEEQRHSLYLARFMEQQGLPLSKSDAVDSVFRFLRRAFNLEMCIMAMLMAEIIAVPYYKSLHDATDSPVLRQICRQLLRDEMQHLQFQIDTLGRLRRDRSPLGVALTDMVHRFLFSGTLLVVWRQHRVVLSAGGYSIDKFWLANWQRYNHLFADRYTLPEKAII